MKATIAAIAVGIASGAALVALVFAAVGWLL